MVVSMTTLTKKKIKRLLKSKPAKYVYIATITTIINVLIYLLSYHVIIRNVIVSNVIAYIFSITASFFLNKKVVYKCKSKKYKKQIPTFLASKALSFAIDSLVLVCLDKYFNMSSILEKLISNASTTISNYLICDKIVFKEEKTASK